MTTILLSLCLAMSAQGDIHSDTIFLFMNNGTVEAFPREYVTAENEADGQLSIHVIDNTIYNYRLSDISRRTEGGCGNDIMLPTITSFKLNNKYNDQIFDDVDCTIKGDTLITGTVASLSRWVTPSIKLSDDKAAAFIEDQLQESKSSKVKWKGDKEYIAAFPGQRILTRQMQSPEVWSNGTLIQEATYAYKMLPMGHHYNVRLEWLTDKAISVPRIDIKIDGGKIVKSKTEWLNAYVQFDGAGVWPNMADSVKIRGRGNTSWDSNFSNGRNPKNPYRLKFAKKRKPFGLTNGKNWVLLANKNKKSMLSNAFGMRVADLVGAAAANHILPVELYINGDYRGAYDFTEKVGVSNNSINLDDESMAALLELDTYYDETYKFHDKSYSLPVNIKFPDFSESGVTLTQDQIKESLNNFLSILKRGKDIESVCDVDMLARYLMVNELIFNTELLHPKSTYLHNPAIGSEKWIFGPVWDLDWAWGYDLNSDFGTYNYKADFWNINDILHKMEKPQFIKDLRFVSPSLDKAYYKAWYWFMKDGLQDLLDYCDEYYAFTVNSLARNKQKWGDNSDYLKVKNNMRNWLKQRAEYIFSKLNVYDIEDPTVGIRQVALTDPSSPTLVDIYDLYGKRVKANVSVLDFRQGLKPGIYLMRSSVPGSTKGHKVIIH